MDSLSGEENRRPLSSREQGWAQRTAKLLAKTPITPNTISIASMVFSAVGCTAFLRVPAIDGTDLLAMLVLAALCCQMRLLCNLFDGMVAVEGGKQTADGAFWNEFPDRVSDLLFFAGMGVAAGVVWLGFAAAALAILTAYVRELGAANGLGQDFCGPMAKQHRMAIVTIAALLSAVSGLIGTAPQAVLLVGLWIVIIGAGATVIRRSVRMICVLRQR